MDIELLNLIFVLAGSIFGGVGVKLVDKLLSRRQEMAEVNGDYRDELRIDAVSLRKELRLMYEELDSWREKYFDLLKLYNELEIAFKREVYDEDSDSRR